MDESTKSRIEIESLTPHARKIALLRAYLREWGVDPVDVMEYGCEFRPDLILSGAGLRGRPRAADDPDRRSLGARDVQAREAQTIHEEVGLGEVGAAVDVDEAVVGAGPSLDGAGTDPSLDGVLVALEGLARRLRDIGATVTITLPS